VRLSIIVPVYREEKNVKEYLRRMVPLVEERTRDFEIIFCLDPAPVPDGTEDIIIEARKSDDRIKLLRFSRRVGQPMATLAGLTHSDGDAAIVMDVDLQDPPELIGQMIDAWQEGYQVVIPQRTDRDGETWLKKLVAATGYKLINKIADVEIPPNTGDFRLMDRRVVDELVRLKESHGFLRGMVAVVGFRQKLIPFHRPPRFSGTGNYNRFIGSLRIGFNGVFCFSNYALTLSTMFGFVVAGISLLLTLTYLVLKLIGYDIVWGNPTLVILVTFLGGIQLISIGILGEYIGRIYEEVRDRPKFIVDRAEGVGAQRRSGAADRA